MDTPSFLNMKPQCVMPPIASWGAETGHAAFFDVFEAFSRRRWLRLARLKQLTAFSPDFRPRCR
jgi:hypothetical protein